jgi:hypothetical protein
MCSQSKGIGSADHSASIRRNIRTIPALLTVLWIGVITIVYLEPRSPCRSARQTSSWLQPISGQAKPACWSCQLPE